MIILIFIIPVIFVLVGIWGIVKLIIAKKKCTEYVDAAVVEFKIKHSSKGDSFYPVLGYRFEGVDYRSSSNFTSAFLRFKVGDQLGLYIDPDKPERFYCPKETIHRILFYLLFSGMGGLFMYLSYLKMI